MGIFSKLFGNSEPKAETPDAEVYMLRAYLNQLLLEKVKREDVTLLTFFASTQKQLCDLCTEEAMKNKILLHPANIHVSPGVQVCFAERHPLQKQETEAIQRLRQSGMRAPVTAYCALDDSIMMKFGGERVTGLMKSMGMTETESMRHSMISSSIRNAQEKTLKKVTYEQQAKSPEEWYRMNLPGA